VFFFLLKLLQFSHSESSSKTSDKICVIPIEVLGLFLREYLYNRVG